MTALRVVVVDDEPLARVGLKTVLEEEADVEVVAESAGGPEAVTTIRAAKPDVVFLDIAMPDLDGFGIVDQLDSAYRPVVIFVTAHADQALRAFDARALDYLTKPLRRDRVRQAVARARERVRLERGAQPADARPAGPLAIKLAGRLRLVEQRAIDWIEADDDHVVVHAGSQVWRTRETLGTMERRLDPELFVRIHRSTIVRLAEVRELQPWFRGDYVVLLHGGAKLKLTRTYRDRVARRLGRL
jgi:two-component system LytT family response regulator